MIICAGNVVPYTDLLGLSLCREEDNEEDYQERIETQLAAQEEDDVERIKEESRRRRQAILEKYKQQHQEKTDVEQPPTIIGGMNFTETRSTGT